MVRLPKSLTTVTGFSKFMALLLFISLPYLGFGFGVKYGTEYASVEQEESTYRTLFKPTDQKEALTPTLKNGTDYAGFEISMMNDAFNVQHPKSYVFSIELPEFDTDWECINPGYISESFQVFCQQKECSYKKPPQWPTQKLTRAEEEACTDELYSRTYPRSLGLVTLTAVEKGVEKETTDRAFFSSADDVRTTPKGRFYSFTNALSAANTYEYEAIFYSPFELTPRLSRYGGEYYGSDFIYGQYTLSAKVVGDDIEEQAVHLLENIIDAIVFTQYDS